MEVGGELRGDLDGLIIAKSLSEPCADEDGFNNKNGDTQRRAELFFESAGKA